VNAGALSLDNLLNLKAQLGNEELNVINARNNVVNAQVNLALLLQLPDPENFRVVKPSRLDIGVVLQAEIDGVYQTALVNQPQIQAAELRTQQAQYSLAAAKGGRSPRLSAFANLSTLYSDSRLRTAGLPSLNGQETPIGYVQGNPTQIVVQPGFDVPTEIVPRANQFNDNLGYGFGFTLTIPILNNWQVNNQIQRARNAHSLTLLQLEGSRNQLFTDVATSVTNYRAAATRVEANERNVKAQNESYKFSELRFNEGMMNAVDYLNAKNRAQIAASNLLQSRFELLFRAKILDFYLGKPIVLN
jgi:outer membrane protein